MLTNSTRRFIAAENVDFDWKSYQRFQFILSTVIQMLFSGLDRPQVEHGL